MSRTTTNSAPAFIKSPCQIWRELRGLDRFELTVLSCTNPGSAGPVATRLAHVEAGLAAPSALPRLWAWFASAGVPQMSEEMEAWYAEHGLKAPAENMA